MQSIRDRQLAFFIARVTGERAKEEWRAHVKAAVETLLEAPLGEVTSVEAIERALDAAATRASFQRMVRPISRAIHLESVKELRRDKTRVGHYVPAEARKKIDQLLLRPKLVQEKLLRRVLEQDAMEETMRDVLYDALKEFNERVNPFVADWGLPGIMKKLGPFGFGPVAKSIEGVRAEFDKRMEPEMRKFLAGFSRKALTKVGDLVSKNDGSQKFVELRRAVVSWVYEQEVREFLTGVDDEGATLAHGAALDVTEHVSALSDVRKRRREALDAFFAAHHAHPLRRVLADYGGAFELETEAFADASWPAVRRVLESDEVKATVKRMLDEFWDAEEAAAKT